MNNSENPTYLVAVSLPSDLVVPGGSPLELSDLADRPPGGQRSTAGIIQLVLGLTPSTPLIYTLTRRVSSTLTFT